MHIKVDRNPFLSELYCLLGVAGAKQAIPILSHVRVETGSGKVTLRATDLDLAVTTECEADVREDGTICLPARKLMEIVKSLPQAGIEIKSNDLFQATITCKPSRFKLNGVGAGDFPEFLEFSGELAEVPVEILSRFIPRVLHAVGQDGSRYALNGAKLEITDKRIRMVATDGHRLALVEHEGQFSESLDVIVPKKTLSELAKLCPGSDEPLQIGKTDNHIHFHLGKRRIVSCLLTGNYPDYAAVLPKQNVNRFKVGRSLISPAVKRVALMADDRSRAIQMQIRDGCLQLSSQSMESGEAGESLSIEYSGDSITTGFNAVYLNDFFNAIEEDEVLFELGNGKNQAQLSVQTAQQDRCLAVVMPMRL